MPTISDAVSFAVLLAGVSSAAVIDAGQRRIPNAISMGTAAAGFGLAVTGLGRVSVTSSLAGFAIGFLLMLPGHVLGATGAGDVKLFAGAGALLGAARTLQAFLFVAIAGGVLALGVAWWRGRLGRSMTLMARLCGRPVQAKAEIESHVEHNRFPYGPAIAVGCVLAALI